MVDGWYVAGVLAIGFGITVTLRALPFAILRPLRKSALVRSLVMWMPVGILAILTVTTFVSSAAHGRSIAALVAIAVTAAAHLGLGRRTLLSVGLGTVTFVLLVNLA